LASGRVAGEVADGQLLGVAESGYSKFVVLLSLIASLNLALFVFNLIPLLPLDGGHAAGALWEGLKRQVAKVRGRPNPGYVDVAKALPLAYAVSIALDRHVRAADLRRRGQPDQGRRLTARFSPPNTLVAGREGYLAP
jgi:membrane-associated protease RseP (regulator of RpoE activity)